MTQPSSMATDLQTHACKCVHFVYSQNNVQNKLIFRDDQVSTFQCFDTVGWPVNSWVLVCWC